MGRRDARTKRRCCGGCVQAQYNLRSSTALTDDDLLQILPMIDPSSYILIVMRLTSMLLGLAMATSCHALNLFTDTFTTGASSVWGNERGSWYASGGAYNCLFPSNNPTTMSTLPWDLTDCAIDVDIRQVCDGGIYLRWNPTSQSGVLLVTGGEGWGVGLTNGNIGRDLYWHTVHNGSFSGATNLASNVFTPGQNVHVRVVVQGNVYQAYVDGVLRSTLVDSSFPHGRVGLYDFAPANAINQAFDQRFDNVRLTAYPSIWPSP